MEETGGNTSLRIVNEAESLFTGNVFEELKAWYDYTLQDDWQYVVFAVRRSYILALLMEEITGRKMEESSSAAFLTDAALFLRCNEMADSYRRCRRFPRILICDDIMIHGRNINHILEGLEAEICRLLAGEYEEDRVKAALTSAIHIHVYVRTSTQLLLLGKYEWKFHFIRKEAPSFWHQFASDVASLISCSDVANACYVYTELLSEDTFSSMDIADTYIHTVYQNVNQYAKFQYLYSGDKVKAVFSLRIVQKGEYNGYRVIPFVFLPNLNGEETDLLFRAVKDRLPDEGQLRGWFTELESLHGKRTFNELVTLLFSHAVLQEFNEKYKISPEEEETDREIRKLARNYNQFGLGETAKLLKGLLQARMFTIPDLMEILEKAVPDERKVMELEEDKGRERIEKVIADERKREIKVRVEDYFYNRGWDDEASAYELTKKPYYNIRGWAKRRARGCCFTLTELNKGYTGQESEYCMAYFLQMMDAGVAAVSSYAPNDVKVVGFAQFAKAGEQSLFIEPLRKNKYIPLLERMEYECKRRGSSIEREIEKYGRAFPDRYTPEFIEEMQEFVRNLAEIGQSPEDWLGNYLDRIDLDEWIDRDSVQTEKERIFRYIDEMEEYRSHYKAYVRKRL